MPDLSTKTVIITGACSGMGASHARSFAQWGANVVIADIAVDKGLVLADEIGSRAVFMDLDVTSEDGWHHVVSETERLFGPVTGLVNNAGIGKVIPFDELSADQFQIYFEINQLSVFLGMKAAAPSMRKSGGGSIVNISSTAGLRSGRGILAYTATKFAVTGMSKAASIDLGPDGIRVNSVHPGLIQKTGLFEGAGTYHNPIIERTPLRRVGDVIEVSELVAFLLSDASGFCTGSEFVIDGGFLAQQ